MKTIEQLYSGFYLSKESANSKISDCTNPLRVPPLETIDGYKSPEIDYKHFSFAEKNNIGEIEYFHGLKNYLQIKRSKLPPIFIFDNHNHAIAFRYNIIYSKDFKNVELLHIDQHSDCRSNGNHLGLNWNTNELEKVFLFGNEKCNVGNFIPPAIESGIISSQIQIRSNTALKNLKINKNQIFILDIDLDFCLDGISKNRISQEAVNLLKNKFYDIGKDALGITIATSPYFLAQDLAISILDILIS